MLEFLAGLPPWGLKALALTAGLVLAGILGFFANRLFKKVDRQSHPE